MEWSDGKGLRRNALRKWCSKNFLHFLRMVEWHNLVRDLEDALRDTLRWRIPELPPPDQQATPERIHRSILAGVPLQIGIWRPEDKVYRGAGGRDFAVFPGSALFRRSKRADWLMGSELVETSRLWMRRAATLDPAWVEQVAPQLCAHHAYDPAWDRESGQVFAKERVTCGGLTIIDGRRISYARCNPAAARDIMIRDGILAQDMKHPAPYLQHLADMREEVRVIESKLRRRDLIWCKKECTVFLMRRVPATSAPRRLCSPGAVRSKPSNRMRCMCPETAASTPARMTRRPPSTLIPSASQARHTPSTTATPPGKRTMASRWESTSTSWLIFLTGCLAGVSRPTWRSARSFSCAPCPRI